MKFLARGQQRTSHCTPIRLRKRSKCPPLTALTASFCSPLNTHHVESNMMHSISVVQPASRTSSCCCAHCGNRQLQTYESGRPPSMCRAYRNHSSSLPASKKYHWRAQAAAAPSQQASRSRCLVYPCLCLRSGFSLPKAHAPFVTTIVNNNI